MEEKKYVGPYEVLGVSLSEHKTAMGGEILIVSFASGPAKMMTRRMYDLVATPEPRDLNSLEEAIINPICDALFTTLKEYDVTAIQLETLLLAMSRVGKGMFDKASHVAFTKEVYGQAQTDAWVRGAPSFTDYRTLNECEAILKNNESGEQK